MLFIAAATYILGLNSAYAPTNGDEMVYIHIARMTAESGHWLPLQSELVGMRNTKPPLLFWQGMVAGQWGHSGSHSWALWALRAPSIVYTFATTALLAFFTLRISRSVRTACLAAVVYLLFFSTFRYGRVYLTSAPETFWLMLPLWWVLWLRLPPAAFALAPPVPTPQPQPQAELQRQSSISGQPGQGGAHSGRPLGLMAYTLFGIAMGLGAAYKSFALIAPAAAALWAAIVLSAPRVRSGPRHQHGPEGDATDAAVLGNDLFTGFGKAIAGSLPTILRPTLGLTWSAMVGLGFFALWFVLDPDPAAVWQEFIVNENAGKMSTSQGYWHAAFFGDYPMWTQLWAYPENAGLLLFAVFGTFWAAARPAFMRSTYQSMAAHQWVLLAWLVVWLLVFSLPSQRSARYVIPAMPALAMLMALYWQRIARVWFVLTVLLCLPALLVIARVGWVMGNMGVTDGRSMASNMQVATLLIAVSASTIWFAACFLSKNGSKTAALVAVLGVYSSFTLLVAPLGDAQAQYNAEVQHQLQGKRVAVPNGFTGQFERFHFVLPGASITPYDAEGRNTGAYQPDMPPVERLPYLLAQFDAVVWLQSNAQDSSPSCLPNCIVMGSRWHIRSRHKSGEVRVDNIWHPDQWLFAKEWLIAPISHQKSAILDNKPTN